MKKLLKRVLLCVLSLSLISNFVVQNIALANLENNTNRIVGSTYNLKENTCGIDSKRAQFTNEILNHPRVIHTKDSIMIPNDLIPEDMKFKTPPTQFRSVGATIVAVLSVTYTGCTTVYYISGGFDPCMWLRNQIADRFLTPGDYEIYYETISGKDPNCEPKHSWQCNNGSYTVLKYRKRS